MNQRYPQNPRAEEGGFTAIELVAALAVTVLMLTLAASAVRTYLVRTQITESVARMLPLQHQVAQTFRESGVPPADRPAARQPSGTLAEGSYVDSIDIVDGRIELRFGGAADAAIAGRVLSLTPFETADLQVIWICGNDIPGIGLYPLGFSGGSRQAVHVLTTIEDQFLPEMCR